MLSNDTTLNPFRQLRTLQLVTNKNTRTSNNTTLREFKEAWHSMDRSTFEQTHRYSHHLPSTQTNSKLSTLIIIFNDWNSPYKHSKQQLENPLPERLLQQQISTRSQRMTTTPLTINQSDTRRDWNHRDARVNN